MGGSIAYFNYQVSESKYTLVIGQVQSGKTRYMIDKTEKCLNNDYDAVILLCGSNNALFEQTKNRFNQSFLKKNIRIIDISEKIFSEVRGSKNIIRSVKSSVSLQNLYDLLSNTYENKKIMILDDESDYGSIDISDNKNKESSKIFSIIQNIINLKIHEVYYQAVTATPFANALSKNAFPFGNITLLPINKDYTGSNFFIQNKTVYVTTIDIDKKNLFSDDHFVKKWSEILISHIKRIIDSNEKKTQLLFNIDLTKSVHNKIGEQVKKIIKDIYVIRDNVVFGEYRNNEKWDLVIKELMENVYILNGENNDWNKNEHSILIGGNLVSRGYTFEKLLTTVMYNEPNNKINADVLLQRSRWFGYRKEIFNYMKVFVSEKTLGALEECDILINGMEQNIHDNPNDIESLRTFFKSQNLNYLNLSGKVK